MFFKASDVEGSQDDYNEIPAGAYECWIEKAELKESNNTPGNQYINVMLRVKDGQPQANRCIFDIFVYKGDYKPETVQKTKVRLKGLVNAVGLKDLEKLVDLVDKKVLAKVRYWKAKDGEMKQAISYEKSKSDQDVPF